jgi:hypothetical protein
MLTLDLLENSCVERYRASLSQKPITILLSKKFFVKLIGNLFLLYKMKAALFFLVLVNEAMVLAALAIELNNGAPPSSGCYPL